MESQSILDDEILKGIKNGSFIVDPELGIVKGMVHRNGERKEIGKIQKGSNKKTTSIYFNGYNRTVSIARIIWLSVYGEIQEGQRVEPIIGNSDYSIKNLKLVENDRYLGLWTKDELDILKRGMYVKSWRELSNEIGRSQKSCRQKARKLKLNKPIKKRAWTEEDELSLKKLVEGGKQIVEIAKEMDRTFSSIKLHVRKYGKSTRNNKSRLRELNHHDFYHSLKTAKTYGSAKLSCCLCGKEDYKHCTLHHIDKHRENNNISNIATVCPNCHAEIHGGEHDGKMLFSIWRRVYNDGVDGEIMTNKEEIKGMVAS